MTGTPPWGGVIGTQEETSRQSQDTLERLYLLAGLGTPWWGKSPRLRLPSREGGKFHLKNVELDMLR